MLKFVNSTILHKTRQLLFGNVLSCKSAADSKVVKHRNNVELARGVAGAFVRFNHFALGNPVT